MAKGKQKNQHRVQEAYSKQWKITTGQVHKFEKSNGEINYIDNVNPKNIESSLKFYSITLDKPSLIQLVYNDNTDFTEEGSIIKAVSVEDFDSDLFELVKDYDITYADEDLKSNIYFFSYFYSKFEDWSICQNGNPIKKGGRTDLAERLSSWHKTDIEDDFSVIENSLIKIINFIDDVIIPSKKSIINEYLKFEIVSYYVVQHNRTKVKPSFKSEYSRYAETFDSYFKKLHIDTNKSTGEVDEFWLNFIFELLHQIRYKKGRFYNEIIELISFEFKFYIAPKDYEFLLSDEPAMCLNDNDSKIIAFPLSPSVMLYANTNIKATTKKYIIQRLNVDELKMWNDYFILTSNLHIYSSYNNIDKLYNKDLLKLLSLFNFNN